MEIVGSLSGNEPPIKAIRPCARPGRNTRRWPTNTTSPAVSPRSSATSGPPVGGYNLHRNVLFRGDASVANRTLPFSQFDSQNPEDLWDVPGRFREADRAEVLAIPHNGNLCNGRMFSVEKFDGTPLDRELAEQRARLEPLIEVTQIKGDSEAHPMPLAERRVRRLRDLGQVQPQRHRGQEAGDAASPNTPARRSRTASCWSRSSASTRSSSA